MRISKRTAERLFDAAAPVALLLAFLLLSLALSYLSDASKPSWKVTATAFVIVAMCSAIGALRPESIYCALWRRGFGR